MVIQIQENLLEQDVIGFKRWDEFLYFFFDSTFNNCNAAEQFTRVLENPCNKGSFSPATGSSHPLEKRRNRIWRTNLDHNIKVSNIYAKFQSACADDTGTFS